MGSARRIARRGAAAVLLVVGCRSATRVAEVPRVDLALDQGNRGYLLGSPPSSPAVKATRQMVRTDLELPTFSRVRSRHGQEAMGIAPPEIEPSPGGQPPRFSPDAQIGDVYTVRSGDSLWSIAAQPDIYGQAAQWRRILEANRELLKDRPDRIRAGMKLKIPRSDLAERSLEPSKTDHGLTTYHK